MSLLNLLCLQIGRGILPNTHTFGLGSSTGSAPACCTVSMIFMTRLASEKVGRLHQARQWETLADRATNGQGHQATSLWTACIQGRTLTMMAKSTRKGWLEMPFWLEMFLALRREAQGWPAGFNMLQLRQ